MSSGWYKQQRYIVERPWFKDADMVQLYTYLKSMAYVTDGKYKGIIIRRGSCPTTRSEMSEMTGLSARTIDRVLRRLVSYNEIIVKANNKFSIVTICDYDNYDNPDSLFGSAAGTTGGIAAGTTGGIAAGTTHLSTIENIIQEDNNILTSTFSPYKKEREKEDLALEVKKRYNKVFDGKLQSCIRLTMPTKLMVMECISRFGIQSVDLVFQQVLSEPFSLGQNKTGFIASFQYIFTPKRFQEYLERAQLRIRKQSQPQQDQKPQQTKSVGIITETQVTAKQSQEDYEREMREYAQQHPDSYAANVVASWDRQNETNNIR
jgi:hypothetical protein